MQSHTSTTATVRRTGNIAAICNNTLVCLGLQYLLEGYFQPVNITCFPNFDDFSASGTAFDYFLVDAESFILNTDFFLQRRSKTIILSDKCDASPSTCNLMNVRATPETIIEQLKGMFVMEGNQEGENRELSMREIDVLQLIVQGNTNKDIADKLHISLNTVLSHRKNITSKLGIKTTSGLTFYALMNGLF